ncbi:hypothetical protein E2C01_029532 [Portunus trituberculatus]|uniref:Uncharacterized protein n=1 Tax=Portunus trituberculatus TaxID=210409 RepID=A0A5B7ERP8_PORTR|nr:hypothetical protein [Portunus trituberculatus]
MSTLILQSKAIRSNSQCRHTTVTHMCQETHLLITLWMTIVAYITDLCGTSTSESKHSWTLITFDPAPPVPWKLCVHPLYVGLKVRPLGKASTAVFTFKGTLPQVKLHVDSEIAHHCKFGTTLHAVVWLNGALKELEYNWCCGVGLLLPSGTENIEEAEGVGGPTLL